MASGHRRRARAVGMADPTPKRRASSVRAAGRAVWELAAERARRGVALSVDVDPQ